MEKDWYLNLKTTTNLPQFSSSLADGVFLRRLNKREKLESFENREFLSKVRNNFLERAKEKGYTVIDTTQSIQKSQEIIQNYFINFFGKHHNM